MRGGRGGGCVVGLLHVILVVGSFILLHVRVRVVNKIVTVIDKKATAKKIIQAFNPI